MNTYMTIKNKITTAFATGAVLANALAPMAFAQEVQISGNGSFSDNTVRLNTSSDTTVDQDNYASITNNVDSNASTGGNSADFNTGGDVTIRTGDATNNTEIVNAANLNVATVESCNGCGGSTDVLISGNGAFSDNTARVRTDNDVTVRQDNYARIYNDVDADAKTGGNDAGFNTGGDVTIDTGDASTHVGILNMANANYAVVSGEGDGNGSSIRILDNGAFSDNSVRLHDDSDVKIDQDNYARIYNDVDADAKTGENDAEFNTGGDVTIRTGDAETDVEIDNLVNFNAAAVDCDCLVGDLLVKIAGNGAFSDNRVNLDLDDDLKVYQDNSARLYNDVDSDAKTGYNEAGFNVGWSGSDPSVITGDAESSTHVGNHSNVNWFGNSEADLPELGLEFDLHELWDLLHSWMS